MKQCTKCKEVKESTKEYFHKEIRASDGLRSECKICINKRNKEYIKNNHDKYLKKQKEIYLNNKEERLEYKKNYYLENKEEIIRKQVIYTKKRRDGDPVFKLCSCLRNGLYKCLKGLSKKHRTMEYIGCDIHDLWKYIESKFKIGMTRENYGEWHVDHIKPLSSFDFTGENIEEELFKAWHYTNLQPLWAEENLRKGTSH